MNRRAPILCLLLLVSCASKTARHQAVTVDATVYQSLSAVQDLENEVFAQHLLTPSQHQQINADLALGFGLIVDATRAIQSWQPGQPAPPQITGLLAAIQAAITDVSAFMAGVRQQAAALEQLRAAEAKTKTLQESFAR